eukprot:TRINITY_DN7235_c0_g1_i1.p1 TRINITY_DN7235_c0_g1~~TRINITY_DN7235_c0_g1_i1.p1  ORF type:complete len:110 (+),score=19.36 TRINITY_DN7235_c0_g1_i1:63-392(+)
MIFFFNDTATTEIYTRSIVGSVRCVQETVSTQSTWDNINPSLISKNHQRGEQGFSLLNMFYEKRIQLLNTFYEKKVQLLNTFYGKELSLLNTFQEQDLDLLNKFKELEF